MPEEEGQGQETEQTGGEAVGKPAAPDWLKEALARSQELAKAQTERAKAAEARAREALETARTAVSVVRNAQEREEPRRGHEPEEEEDEAVVKARRVAREELDKFKKEATAVLSQDREALMQREAAKAEKAFFAANRKFVAPEVLEEAKALMDRVPLPMKQDEEAWESAVGEIEGKRALAARRAEAEKPPATAATSGRVVEEAPPKLDESTRNWLADRLGARSVDDATYGVLSSRKTSVVDYMKAREKREKGRKSA